MCNRRGPVAFWCDQHRIRYYSYEHVGPRPVIQRIEFGYVNGDEKEVPRPPAVLSRDGKPVITVYVELRMSGGKARTRPPWTSVFCLRDRPDLSGSGVRQVIAQMVATEIKRLGWGYSRGVRCQP